MNDFDDDTWTEELKFIAKLRESFKEVVKENALLLKENNFFAQSVREKD